MTAETFYKELQYLIDTIPKSPTKTTNCENCEYANSISNSKNIFFGFDSASCEDSMYIADSFDCKDVIDCDYAVSSELCYESVDPFKAYNCDYMSYCANIRDSSYCHWCWRSNDLFGCVNLVGKSFCVFNRQLTEQDYRQAVAYYRKWPAEKILGIVEDLKKRYPVTQTIEAFNENTTYGNYIHYNKNCYMCFDAAHDEDSAYLYDTFDAKICFDMTYTVDNSQASYEVVSSLRIFNSEYVLFSKNCIDSSYLFNCLDVKNSLGCVNLAHKQYCILNRQFTKEDYERISKDIKAMLRKENEGWNNLYY